MFAAPQELQRGLSAAAQFIAEANAICIADGNDAGQLSGLNREDALALSPELISQQYPLFASSLYNLIQNAETRMGVKKAGVKK